jgi:hypothetical protein
MITDAIALDWRGRDVSAWMAGSGDRVLVQAALPVELFPAQLRLFAAQLVALAATVEGTP